MRTRVLDTCHTHGTNENELSIIKWRQWCVNSGSRSHKLAILYSCWNDGIEFCGVYSALKRKINSSHTFDSVVNYWNKNYRECGSWGNRRLNWENGNAVCIVESSGNGTIVTNESKSQFYCVVGVHNELTCKSILHGNSLPVAAKFTAVPFLAPLCLTRV